MSTEPIFFERNIHRHLTRTFTFPSTLPKRTLTRNGTCFLWVSKATLFAVIAKGYKNEKKNY